MILTISALSLTPPGSSTQAIFLIHLWIVTLLLCTLSPREFTAVTQKTVLRALMKLSTLNVVLVVEPIKVETLLFTL
jgi:hypothetical protein